MPLARSNEAFCICFEVMNECSKLAMVFVV